MARRLGNFFGRRTAEQAGRRNPALLATVRMSSEIYEGIPLKNFVDDDQGAALARKLYLEINLICNSLSPVTTCREKIAGTMIQFASYQVLVIPPPPEPDPSGLRGQPGISGGLKEHLVRIAETNGELRSQLYDMAEPITFDIVWQYVQRTYWENYWFLETFNAARAELGDCDKHHDWYLTFQHAACANQEHVYRREIGLPPAFDEAIASDAANAYSIFTDIVLSGATDPEREWRDYHKGSNIPAPGVAP